MMSLGRIFSIVAITALPVYTAHLLDPQSDPCVTGDCLQRYFCTLDQCDATFNPGDMPTSDPAYQQILDSRAACKEGADIRLSACDTGTPTAALGDEWFTFLDDLARCRTKYGANGDQPNPEDLANCYQAVTNLFRARVNNIPDPNGCTIGGVSTALQTIPFHISESLRNAALQSGRVDGRYEVQANSTLSFSAGLNTTPGDEIDVRQYPCIKRAAAIAIYETKQGIKVTVADVDMNTFDGVNFDIHLAGTELIDTTDIDLVCVYFDDNSLPVYGEIGLLAMKPSPINGDWNRDQVLNSQDITDFLESYNAQTNRADLNQDDQIDTQDAAEYLDSIAD